jgi:hypothetical protein
LAKVPKKLRDEVKTSLADDALNISLAAGHTYYVSCVLTTMNNTETFTIFLEPFYNGETKGYQWSVAQSITEGVLYYLCIPHSFLIVSGDGGTLNFTCMPTGSTPTVDPIGSLVTVMCIE